jgi:PAS domain S-box-containing protein
VKNIKPSNNELRRQAEAKLIERRKKAPPSSVTEADTRRLVHELEVHQIELEMQNEELEQSRAQAEKGLRQYIDLYDFAPMGYFTLARDSVIHQVNLAGSNLLGEARGELIKRRFSVFVAVESRSAFNTFLEKVFESGQKETCEVALQKDGVVTLRVHIEAACGGDEQEGRIVAVDITKRKRAELALQDSEQRLRKFLDATSDMAFLKDESFRHIIANSALCKFYGKTESEVLGKTDFELMDEKAAAKCRKTDEQTLRSNTLHISEEAVGNRYYETIKFPVTIAGGKRGIGAYIRDITERKQAEELLQESERKFRETVLNLDEGYYSVTLDGVLLEHNKAFSRILGFDPAADLKGRQLPDFWQNPEERDVYLQELAAKGSITNYQVNAKTKTGEKINVIIHAHLVKDKNSLPLRIEGVVLDITQRKHFEDELLASEARLRAIVDSTPFPIALVDVDDNNIEYWSRSAIDLFGHTAPTTPEWYQLAYPDPEYRREVIDRWKPCLETARLSGKPVNTGEYRVSCHDGSARICELYATFLSDKLIVTFNDITERRRAEEELRQRENLLHKVFEVLPIGLWFADKDGKLLRGNPAGVKIWGAEPKVGPSEYGTFKARRLPSGEELAPEDWALAHTIREGVTIVDEILEIDAFDGKKKVILNFTAPVHYENGAIQGAIVANLDITESKRMEAELKENARLLRIAGEKAKLGGWSVDLKNNLCTWSNETAAIHEMPAGYAPLVEEGINYYAPEWREKITKVFTQCAQKGIPYDEEMEIITANGKRVWVQTMGEAVKDEAGKIIKVQGAIQDITEHKQAEERLRLKNLVFDTSLAANSIADLAGVIKEVNEAFVKIWGYSGRNEVIGNSIACFLNDPDEAAAIISALNAHGEWQGDFTAKKKDESTFIAHSTATVIRDENGQVAGYQSSVINITERKLAEEALREKEVQYRHLADTGLALIWTSGTDKLCNYFNKPWLKFTGRTLEQEIGNGWTQGVHPADLDSCVQIYVTAFDKREAFDMEYRLRSASGEYRWIRDLGTPNYNGSGEFIGYIGHCFDINAQRGAEDEIRKLNEDLEQRINERTAELRQTITQLEETNRVFVGRELKMIELKERIAELEKKT